MCVFVCKCVCKSVFLCPPRTYPNELLKRGVVWCKSLTCVCVCVQGVGVLNDPTVAEIAKKYNKPPAQIVLRCVCVCVCVCVCADFHLAVNKTQPRTYAHKHTHTYTHTGGPHSVAFL